jgi:hypothetical protein
MCHEVTPADLIGRPAVPDYLVPLGRVDAAKKYNESSPFRGRFDVKDNPPRFNAQVFDGAVIKPNTFALL